MRANRAALPVAGAAGCCVSSCLAAVLAGRTEVALLWTLLLAFSRAFRLAVLLSLLLAVTGLAELAGCAEGVERAIVDSELESKLGTELLSGTDSLAAASTWQQERVLLA